jgi:hypothetical protein
MSSRLVALANLLLSSATVQVGFCGLGLAQPSSA